MTAVSKLALAAALTLSAAIAMAQQRSGNDSLHPAPSGAQGAESATASANSSPQMSEGEIRKIDKDAKKITIKHGELKNLDMPPMTMVFQIRDPGLLDKVKQGDKVRFVAEKVGGQFAVTQIEPKQ